MPIDIYSKSSQLLEAIANSLADRNPNLKEFCFASSEKNIVENWLKEIVHEILLENA